MSAEMAPSRTDMTNFPLRVSGDMAWVPEELERETLFIIELDGSHVEELENAMDTFKSLHDYRHSLYRITDICANRSWPGRGLHLP